jgi:hypothetical protein
VPTTGGSQASAHRRPLDPGKPAVVETAVILEGAAEDRGVYDYDLDVKNWSTGVRNRIDPELRIDN